MAVAATDGGRQQRRIVIARQGGGSHTAFTAGVLKRLLGAKELTGYQVCGLSCTSGGAVCALLAWLGGDPFPAPFRAVPVGECARDAGVLSAIRYARPAVAT